MIDLPPKFRRKPGGCDGCRKRHIPCDQSLPGCLQCTKRGIECLGYTKKYRWVEGPSARAETRKLRTVVGKDSGISDPERRSSANFSVEDFRPETSKDQDKYDNALLLPMTNLSSALLPSFESDFSEDCRQKYFLDHYFGSTANFISIVEEPDNPFGRSLKQYMCRSQALNCTIVAMAAQHMANSNMNQDGIAYAWHYRMMAVSYLRKDLRQQDYSTEMLVTVLFLGTTEFWFDPKNSGVVHLRAAKQLLFHIINAGVKVPLFLSNYFCWFETLLSFVSDYEGVLTTYSNRAESQSVSRETIQQDQNIIFDPITGIWGTLIPHVGRVGTIVRRLRKGADIESLKELIDLTETDLLEWKHLNLPCPDEHAKYYVSSTDTAKECYSIAEAYRLSALLTLYNYSPYLLAKRASLLFDIANASEFLSELAHSAVALLQQIRVDSSLWLVCSIPILSAGQLITEESDRDFLRSVIDTLSQKTQLSTVKQVGQLLEDVWRRRDAGSDVWWMDILDETGIPMLIN